MKQKTLKRIEREGVKDHIEGRNAEIRKLRYALEDILALGPLRTQHDHYIAMLKARSIALGALDRVHG